MKIFITSLISLLSTIAISAQGLDGSTNKLDFGQINKTTQRKITLYNRTERPIVILDAKVDCNCTKVQYSPRPILKGDSTVVDVTYIPKDNGAFYKSVTLKTSSGTDFKFIVRGTVTK